LTDLLAEVAAAFFADLAAFFVFLPVFFRMRLALERALEAARARLSFSSLAAHDFPLMVAEVSQVRRDPEQLVQGEFL
jgi:hypothetical protein